jgi:20S proteasome subunit alpha 5
LAAAVQVCWFTHRPSQVEYALEAIKLGSTSIGIQTAEVLPLFSCAFRAFCRIQSTSLAHFTLLLTAWQGVVLAVEKRITSPLLESSSVEKIIEIDR